MAVAPAEQTYTAFTGELIKTLTDGVPDGAELLDMPPIYRHLRRSMRALGLPEPQGLTAGDAGDLDLVRNIAYVSTGPAPDASGEIPGRAQPVDSVNGDTAARPEEEVSGRPMWPRRVIYFSVGLSPP